MADKIQIAAYRKALEAAEREMNDVLAKLREFEELQNRAATLKSTIGGLTTLIGHLQVERQETRTELPRQLEDEPVSSAAQLIILHDEVQSGPKRYEQIEQILRESGQPMSFSKIVQEFRARQWPLSKTAGVQIIRNVVIRKAEKKELFMRNEAGLVGLIEWQRGESDLNAN